MLKRQLMNCTTRITMGKLCKSSLPKKSQNDLHITKTDEVGSEIDHQLLRESDMATDDHCLLDIQLVAIELLYLVFLRILNGKT